MMSSLDAEAQHYREQLDEWIAHLGLPQYQPDNHEVEKIITMSAEDIKLTSSVELSEYTVILAQYALFLQQKTNECQSFLKWSFNMHKRLFGDDKTVLNRWIKKAEVRMDRVQFLARRIELIGQSLSNLVRSRYNERG